MWKSKFFWKTGNSSQSRHSGSPVSGGPLVMFMMMLVTRVMMVMASMRMCLSRMRT